MRIHLVRIERFRGIKLLEWKVAGSMVCLIGPGDSGKSTILDAIEAALSSRWSLALTDDDFFQADTSQPIVISVTVGGVPEPLLSVERFGLDLQGWSPAGELHDEPADNDEEVLTVRLTVDDSLEPTWVVKNARNGEGRPISSREREMLGVSRIGTDPERHLRWGRGSALSRLTNVGDDVGGVLVTAAREARASLGSGELPELERAAEVATTALRGFGVDVRSEQLQPALAIEPFTNSSAAVILQDGSVPAHAIGMGSRRLAAMALQSAALRSGAVLLVDELEHGLEPHRLRNLASRLDRIAGKADGFGQVITTTHSPIVLVELPVDRIRVVRADAGTLTILGPGAELQGRVRTHPDALLARRVLVTEGKTEVGLLRALDPHWEATHHAPLAHQGVSVVNGGGASVCLGVALALMRLGYPVCVLADDDVPLPPADQAAFLRGGGTLILWGNRLAVEERIAADAPLAVLQQIFGYGCALNGEAAVIGDLKGRLQAHAALVVGPDLQTWVSSGVPEPALRAALGTSAKTSFGGWFKRTDHGEWLGNVVAASLSQIPNSPLARRIADAESWCFPARAPAPGSAGA